MSVIAADEASGTIEDEDSQICLARQILSTRDNGAITIRVVLPPTVAVASAVANARAEIKRLNTKLGKSVAQLEKLKALTSRSTYVEMSPPDVQAKHAQKIDQLSADIEDIQGPLEILGKFAR